MHGLGSAGQVFCSAGCLRGGCSGCRAGRLAPGAGSRRGSLAGSVAGAANPGSGRAAGASRSVAAVLWEPSREPRRPGLWTAGCRAGSQSLALEPVGEAVTAPAHIPKTCAPRCGLTKRAQPRGPSPPSPSAPARPPGRNDCHLTAEADLRDCGGLWVCWVWAGYPFHRILLSWLWGRCHQVILTDNPGWEVRVPSSRGGGGGAVRDGCVSAEVRSVSEVTRSESQSWRGNPGKVLSPSSVRGSALLV